MTGGQTRLAAIVVGTVLAVPAVGRAADNAAAPTFTKDVAPIFQAKCEGCHRPDNMAPMAFAGATSDRRPLALMARQTSRPVQTFTIGFGDRAYDEIAEARATAEHFGAEHHEQIVTPDCVRVAETLAIHYDEPFADASAIPTFYVAELARRHVTVCLTGDGGDELFAGYTPYADALARTGTPPVRAFRSVLAAGARHRRPFRGQSSPCRREEAPLGATASLTAKVTGPHHPRSRGCSSPKTWIRRSSRTTRRSPATASSWNGPSARTATRCVPTRAA